MSIQRQQRQRSLRLANHQNLPSSLKVLFVGNSFTARNDLPRLVATIARSWNRLS
jgi:hypothetical protein